METADSTAADRSGRIDSVRDWLFSSEPIDSDDMMALSSSRWLGRGCRHNAVLTKMGQTLTPVAALNVPLPNTALTLPRDDVPSDISQGSDSVAPRANRAPAKESEDQRPDYH